MRNNIYLLLIVSNALYACSPSRGDAREASGANSAVVALVDAPDRFFRRDSVSIRYRVIGDGPPVLLLHGYTDRVEMWAGTADSLAADFQVIVPDLRGHGLSTKFDEPGSYGRQMVDDLTGLLDHLGVRAAHVIGYSMGGVLAAHLALDDPPRALSTTLVAGSFWGRDSAGAARVIEPYLAPIERGEGLGPFFRYILPTWPDSAIDAIVPTLQASNDSLSLVASLRGFLGLMLDTTDFARARTPALAIVSVKDPLLEYSRFVARAWPGLRLVELPRGDHADIFLAPELVTEFRKLAR